MLGVPDISFSVKNFDGWKVWRNEQCLTLTVHYDEGMAFVTEYRSDKWEVDEKKCSQTAFRIFLINIPLESDLNQKYYLP